MTDYYRTNYLAYHLRTFQLDPASFLKPLVNVLPHGSKVLDVGCGSGRDMLWLKHRGYRVVGLERAVELADLAQQLVECEVIRADFESFDFSSLSVDAILLVGALVHLPHQKMPAVLKNIMKALNPGGRVLITLKEGQGQMTKEDGRVFYLWQSNELSSGFRKLGILEEAHFSQKSIAGASDIWLTYLLRRPVK